MSAPPALRLSFADYQLDEANARLTRASAAVELQPKAFDLLCALARRPGQLVTKDELLDAVWGHRHVSESVLKTTISQLRAALEDDARSPRFIETASRRGYRFIAVLEGSGSTTRADAAHADALPPPPVISPPPSLVGRQQPLARLASALGRARQRQRQLVLVAGEAGIGKSTLLDSFTAGLASLAAQAPGIAVALGQCVELYGAGEAYMPVLEAINLLCRDPESGPALISLMRRVAPSWLAQLPWYLDEGDRQPLQREVAGATQDRMLREFGELIDRVAAERPLVLVLEDLHWSDHATVQLLGYLARRRQPAALMLVASFRPAEVIAEEHPLASLRQELRLHRLCEELDLESFSETEVDTLVADRLEGARAPEDFVQALHLHTDGLPLFVVNVLDELLAEGKLRREAEGWRFPAASEFGLPRHVAGVVEKQITRLAPQRQRLLAAASVLGTEFSHLLAAELLERPAAELHAELDDMVARGNWLRPAGVTSEADGRVAACYAFRHALYRHVHYQRTGEAQRVQWHRRAAAALLARHGASAVEVAGELAMHFERGGEPRQAAAWLATAAARAMGRSAAQEALRAARHGLSLLGDAAPPELALDLHVLEGVALTRIQVISQPEVAAVFERARRLADQVSASPARARAMQGLWWVSFARGDLPAARTLAERIDALAAGSPEPGLRLAAHNAMGMTLAMSGDLLAAREHLDRSVSLYREVADALPPGGFVQDPGVEAMGYLGLVNWWCGEAAVARRYAAEAVARARAIRHPISELIALNLSSVMHLFAGEREQALTLINELFAVIERHQLPPGPGSFGWVRGNLLASMGRTEEGLALIEAGERSTYRTGMRIGLPGYHLQLADALRYSGRLAEAAASIEAGLALAERSGECALLSPLLRHHAEARQAIGDQEGAQAVLRRAHEVALSQGARFHELMAMAAARRLRIALPWEAPGRVGELRSLWQGDPSPVLAQAFTQLGG
jgi:DNA-binding winged helix-turn-helix (wHTH) protein